MAAQQITVEIDATGATTVSTAGFTGRACLDATRDLERALGKTVNDQKTPEYRRTSTATTRVRS